MTDWLISMLSSHDAWIVWLVLAIGALGLLQGTLEVTSTLMGGLAKLAKWAAEKQG